MAKAATIRSDASVLRVKIQPLIPSAFAPYGQVLEEGQLIYPQADEGRVAMEILRLGYRLGARRMDQLAIHHSYNQTFIPLEGSLVLVVAPPPKAKGPNPMDYEVDYGRLAAFLVGDGQVTHIHQGTWHNILTLGGSCSFVNVTRKKAGEGNSPAAELEGKIERANAIRGDVEFVDLVARDNRVIELEL